MTKDPSSVDATLRTYVGRQGLVREALEDPQYRMQIDWLLRMLTAVDDALDAEHVPPGVHSRIIHRVLFGCAPDEQAAADRLLDRQRAYEEAHLRPIDASALEQALNMIAEANADG